MVALVLEFGQHDERDDHFVFRETRERPGLRQQDRGIEDVRTAFDACTRYVVDRATL
jgi:hypothetical protein